MIDPARPHEAEIISPATIEKIQIVQRLLARPGQKWGARLRIDGDVPFLYCEQGYFKRTSWFYLADVAGMAPKIPVRSSAVRKPRAAEWRQREHPLTKAATA